MRHILICLLGASMIMACTPEEEMPGPQDGKALFMKNCAVCHGENAKGEGPMARSMVKAPKDLTLISVRHGDKFPKAKIMSIIDGYAKAELTAPGMPEFGDLLKGDNVPFDSGDGVQVPTPRKLVALLEYIETLQVKR